MACVHLPRAIILIILTSGNTAVSKIPTIRMDGSSDRIARPGDSIENVVEVYYVRTFTERKQSNNIYLGILNIDINIVNFFKYSISPLGRKMLRETPKLKAVINSVVY